MIKTGSSSGRSIELTTVKALITSLQANLICPNSSTWHRRDKARDQGDQGGRDNGDGGCGRGSKGTNKWHPFGVLGAINETVSNQKSWSNRENLTTNATVTHMDMMFLKDVTANIVCTQRRSQTWHNSKQSNGRIFIIQVSVFVTCPMMAWKERQDKLK